MAGKRKDLLAESLSRASQVVKGQVIRGGDLSRTDRERLLRSGYLRPVIKGWYLLVTPEAQDGASTPWFASFWDFAACYLRHRFGREYSLGAAASLDLHLGLNVIPTQVAVITTHGGQSVVTLPYETSLVMYEDPEHLPQEEDRAALSNGLQYMSLPLALMRLPPVVFKRRQQDVDMALKLVPDTLELARVMVKGRYGSAGGRIAGAYRALGMEASAQELIAEARNAGLRLVPVNPFEETYVSPLAAARITSPYPARLRALWMSMREKVIASFPPAPGPSTAVELVLRNLDKTSESDAYNSLSIEGFRVTPELIHRLRTGDWNPDADPFDRGQSAAMAARGYTRAFRLVEESIRKTLGGENPGLVTAEFLHNWYRALFSASVEAGLLHEYDLIGYRKHPIFIRGSLHVPPPAEAVPDCMTALLDLLQKEPDAAPRAVLGHFLFVYIHPYMDGNGRLARFLMNVMLVSGGYPWTIIPRTRRTDYMQGLEEASVHGAIEPFCRFLREVMPADAG